MIATPKDLVATVLVGAAAALTWAHVTAAGWPLTDGPRVVAALVFFLALGSCIVGAPPDAAGPSAKKSWYGLVGATTGGLIGVAAVVALITGAEWALLGETGLAVALWAFATTRHLVTPRKVVAA